MHNANRCPLWGRCLHVLEGSVLVLYVCEITGAHAIFFAFNSFFHWLYRSDVSRAGVIMGSSNHNCVLVTFITGKHKHARTHSKACIMDYFCARRRRMMSDVYFRVISPIYLHHLHRVTGRRIFTNMTDVSDGHIGCLPLTLNASRRTGITDSQSRKTSSAC